MENQLFMEMREQLGEIRILLNQPNTCFCYDKFNN